MSIIEPDDDENPDVPDSIEEAIGMSAASPDEAQAIRVEVAHHLYDREYDLAIAARRALPLLVRLGNFIGNGPIDQTNPTSLGERCDVILALKKALARGEEDDTQSETARSPEPFLDAARCGTSSVATSSVADGHGADEVLIDTIAGTLDDLDVRTATLSPHEIASAVFGVLPVLPGNLAGLLVLLGDIESDASSTGEPLVRDHCLVYASRLRTLLSLSYGDPEAARPEWEIP